MASNLKILFTYYIIFLEFLESQILNKYKIINRNFFKFSFLITYISFIYQLQSEISLNNLEFTIYLYYTKITNLSFFSFEISSSK